MKKNISILSATLLVVAGLLPAQTPLDAQIEPIVTKLVAKMNSRTAIKNVAIADFGKLDGTPTELGKYLSEEFAYVIGNAEKSFALIDRSRVNFMLKEAGLEGKGLLDPNTIAKLGKMKGIDAVIGGAITSLGESIQIHVKVLNLETAEVLAAERGTISRTPAIIELEGRELGEATDPLDDSRPAKSKLPTAPKKQSYTAGKVLFECIECRQVGEEVRCKFSITSREENSQITVNNGYWGSKIFDDAGLEYHLNFIRLANWTGNQPVSATLIANIATPAEFNFTEVKRRVGYIPYLTITGAVGEEGFEFSLTHIPVTQN